ncbi:MAG: hypothetical protein VKM92_00315 [Cyanobacteriota bacterium]|nr:hypothetical protein [Cyanobacteriota bacterium]
MERQLDAECAFNAALAEFQATVRPVTSLELAAVVEAARPAFAAGFCFTVRDAGDAMEVSLRHKDGGEEVSASNDHRFPGALLAGLLGIPVCSDGQASEPEPVAAPVAAPAEPTPEPIAAVTSEAADEPDLMGPDSPADIPGDHPSLVPLTAQQTESALLMIKQMEPAARKAFQIAFRNAFDLDRNVTRIAPHITQLRHLEFIDRFTVEAAGGVAA